MSEGVDIRVTAPLRQFIEERSGPTGLYADAGEYIRHLVRQDFGRDEQKRWDRLIAHLTPGMNADESEFVDFDPDELIKEARGERADEACIRLIRQSMDEFKKGEGISAQQVFDALRDKCRD